MDWYLLWWTIIYTLVPPQEATLRSHSVKKQREVRSRLLPLWTLFNEISCVSFTEGRIPGVQNRA